MVFTFPPKLNKEREKKMKTKLIYPFTKAFCASSFVLSALFFALPADADSVTCAPGAPEPAQLEKGPIRTIKITKTLPIPAGAAGFTVAGQEEVSETHIFIPNASPFFQHWQGSQHSAPDCLLVKTNNMSTKYDRKIPAGTTLDFVGAVTDPEQLKKVSIDGYINEQSTVMAYRSRFNPQEKYFLSCHRYVRVYKGVYLGYPSYASQWPLHEVRIEKPEVRDIQHALGNNASMALRLAPGNCPDAPRHALMLDNEMSEMLSALTTATRDSKSAEEGTAKLDIGAPELPNTGARSNVTAQPAI
ncbi:MAG: hypothetical protein HY074_06195 [Deltaproteobacteria bacterium]|nr:hypothetical protein [Deltaproteobacteria bacterium]